MAKRSADSRKFSRKAIERMQASECLRSASIPGGLTLADIQDALREFLPDIPVLNASEVGEYNCGPWIADFKLPASPNKPWTAVVCGSNGKLYALPFTIDDGEVEIAGEATEVERTTDYEFVDEITGRKTPPAKTRSVERPFFRYSTAELSADGDNIFQVRFSSEYPVERTADEADEADGVAKAGERYLEILSHEKDHVDLTRLNRDGAFCDEHVRSSQIGKVRKALVSDDRCGRASIECDLASDLSKTRSEQIRKGTRKNISVGYVRTALIGDKTLSDGRTAKVFAWAANEISSVACPADPDAGEGRSASVHCLGCGGPFDRSSLDIDFTCPDCLAKGRTAGRTKTRAIDSPPQPEATAMSETITIVESEKRATELAKKRETDILARNKDIAEKVDAFIKDHKADERGELGKTLRAIANEFCNRDSSTPGKELSLELGQRCLTEIAKAPVVSYTRKECNASDTEIDKYSLIRAINTAIENLDEKRSAIPKGIELEFHQDMERFAQKFGRGHDATGGFQVPSFVRSFSREPLRRTARGFKRDMFTGDFGAGGALVPTILRPPVIELLRNRTVLDWAGVQVLGGLAGNVVIPRQTAAVNPQALGEIQGGAASQPTFDQIMLRPQRVFNMTVYGKQLLMQATPDIEALVRDDNFIMLGIKIDELGLNGQGANNEPMGIMNTPGINSIVFGGAPTYSSILLMETLIRQNNVYDDIVYLCDSNTRGVLRQTPETLTGSTVVSGETNAIWQGKGDEEYCAGKPARDSQQIPNHQVLAGSFRQFLMAMFGGIDVVVDYYTQAANNEVRLIFNTHIDFVARHPQAFTVSADAGNV